MMSNNIFKKDVIIFTKVFNATEYLKSPTNIGHEFINFYKADNGNSYIYVAPHGSFNEMFKDRVYAVVFLGVGEKHHMRILGYAKPKEINIKQFKRSFKGKGIEKTREEHLRQTELINKQYKEIKYGGKLLNEIYPEPININLTNPYYITFTASEHKILNKNVKPISINLSEYEMKRPQLGYLINGNLESKENNKNIVGLYNEKLFLNIIEYIENNQYKYLWEEPEKLLISDKYEETMLNAIQKEYDENIISSLLTFSLNKHSDFWEVFSRDVLELPIKEEILEINREKNNIDIIIRTKSNVIVIENKVLSDINGRDENDKTTSQLSKYYDVIERKIDIGGEYEGLNPLFFLLKPNYSQIVIDDFSRHEFYKVITYKSLFEVLNNLDIKDKFLLELKNVSELHSYDIDNSIYLEQQRRLFTRIKKI